MAPLRCLLLLTLFASATSFETLFRTQPESWGDSNDIIYCNSWRLAVETNNAGPWDEIPSRCKDLIYEYVKGLQFDSDSMVVANYALAVAKNVSISGNGKDAWIFDVDETLLSNADILIYCAHTTCNSSCYNEWIYTAKAPAITANLWLYEELKVLGFQLIIITGRSESLRHATANNLKVAGYSSWHKLILRGSSDQGKTALAYKMEKRAKLEAKGYILHGNTGDQWSDLLGSPMASRSFKVPNPLYYIA